MKRLKILSSALCMALLATGCNGKTAPAAESQVSTSAAVTTESTAAEETTAAEAASTEATTTKVESKEVSTGSHKVKVEVVTLQSYKTGP